MNWLNTIQCGHLIHALTERSFESKATSHWCAWLIFDMFSVRVCSTRHWQTSGQLVQELNVRTVYGM